MSAKSVIENGKAMLGIEFGSTRIKAVLIEVTKKNNTPFLIRHTQIRQNALQH